MVSILNAKYLLVSEWISSGFPNVEIRYLLVSEWISSGFLMLKFLIMFSFYVSSEKDSPFNMRNAGGNYDKLCWRCSPWKVKV